jgi:SMP-30/Gluconolactonase/LRE-like region
MPSNTHQIIYWALAALAIAVVYQSFLSNFLFVILGIGRGMQTIDKFPWTCTRLHHQLLEGCEHMWLDHDGRKLYGACTSVTSRVGWNPGGNKYNVSARSRTDHVSVLDIDQPGPDGLYGLRQLKVSGYEGDLDLHGFDVRRVSDTLRFWMINHKPQIDLSTGDFLDATVFGANSTVEIFDLDDRSEALKHVKTVFSDAIIAPNGLAVDADGVGFVITNDHDAKVGAFRDLEMLYGSGSLTYCRSDTGECRIAAKKGFAFPNGITSDHNGFYYVAHSVTGIVTVHQFQNGSLNQVDAIPLGYPIDNLAIDAEGSLIAAAIPDVLRFVKASEDPYNLVAPATVLSVNGVVGQLESGAKQYEVAKVVEDKDGTALPSITVTLHDAKSQRLFLAGGFSPFLGICEKQ